MRWTRDQKLVLAGLLVPVLLAILTYALPRDARPSCTSVKNREVGVVVVLVGDRGELPGGGRVQVAAGGPRMWWTRWFKKRTPEQRAEARAEAVKRLLDVTYWDFKDCEVAAELLEAYADNSLTEAKRRWLAFSLWCSRRALASVAKDRPVLREWATQLLDLEIERVAGEGQIVSGDQLEKTFQAFDRAFDDKTPYTAGATPMESGIWRLSKEAWAHIVPGQPRRFPELELLKWREQLLVAPADLLIRRVRSAKEIFESVE